MAQFKAKDRVQFEMPGPVAYTGTLVSVNEEAGTAVVVLDDQDHRLELGLDRFSPKV